MLIGLYCVPELAARETTIIRGTLPRTSAAPAAAVRNPAVTGRDAVLVIDAATGQELDGSNADDLRHPASLTKLMTLYLLFQALDAGRLRLDDALPVSRHAVSMQPTRLGIAAGGTLTVREAALGMIVHSANDAAVVVAEALGGDESAFADLMTQTARQLGMRNSVFRNASGLPNPMQVTTARDLAILARALLNDFPHYYPLFATLSWSFRGRDVQTHNRVLKTYPGADGLKTGYINSSGFNLVTSAVHGGRRLIGVVLGGDSAGERDAIMAAVLDTGFAEAARQQLPPWRSSAIPPTARYQATQFTAPPVEVPRIALAAASSRLPPPAQSSKSGLSQWALQIGAFADAAAAQTALKQALAAAPALRQSTTSSVERITVNNRVLYRARLVAGDEEAAARGCRQLEARKISCTPVDLGGSASAQR